MLNFQIKTISTNEVNTDNDYKVVEVNVTSPSESLYAVCTPIKTK